MDKLLDKINNLEIKITNIDNKIDKIYLLLENDIKKDCNKMSNHINFVENIYEYVKNPMFLICNNINKNSKNLNLQINDKIKINDKKYNIIDNQAYDKKDNINNYNCFYIGSFIIVSSMYYKYYY
tara:strand:- start:74 stop:448 length:375 start_codon:yes stop_codon:yes gene_type:complete